MVELEVKLGPKTGLETVQNEKHAVVGVAPPDDSNQAPLVRVTNEWVELDDIVELEEDQRSVTDLGKDSKKERKKLVEFSTKRLSYFDARLCTYVPDQHPDNATNQFLAKF